MHVGKKTIHTLKMYDPLLPKSKSTSISFTSSSDVLSSGKFRMGHTCLIFFPYCWTKRDQVNGHRIHFTWFTACTLHFLYTMILSSAHIIFPTKIQSLLLEESLIKQKTLNSGKKWNFSQNCKPTKDGEIFKKKGWLCVLLK